MAQRESAAVSLQENSTDIRLQTISERVQESGFLFQQREPECESKTEENVLCKELKHEEIHHHNHHQAAEELDPRIQEELEHLNVASEEINQLELQLEEERSNYRKNLSESARRLYALSSQLGSCIEKARPYHEARRLAKEAQQETQKAALSYERAVSMHAAAREMVYVAEQGFGVDKAVDQTWQEMLNHATVKVNEAEEERLRSEREHMHVTQQCQAAEAEVQSLQKSLKRIISKSKPYFELKAQLHSILEEHKLKVDQLEQHVMKAKKRYSFTLQSLEKISEEIHAQREHEQSEDGSTKSFGTRSPPIGAEAVSGPGSEGRTCDILHKANNWVDGHEAKAEDWVERHRKSGWWEKDQKSTDVAPASDCTSVLTDLERCGSVEHLDQLSTTGEKMEREEDAKGQAAVECSEKELVQENIEEIMTNNPQTETIHESCD